MFSAQANAQEKLQPIALPVKYDEHRFYVQPVTKNNIKLDLFTDTGGGLFIFKDVAEKLQLIKSENAKDEAVDFPVFQTEFSIPAPLGSGGKLFWLERKRERNYSAIMTECSVRLGSQTEFGCSIIRKRRCYFGIMPRT